MSNGKRGTMGFDLLKYYLDALFFTYTLLYNIHVIS